MKYILFVLIALVALSGCMRVTDEAGVAYTIGKDEGGWYALSDVSEVSSGKTLKALVKGSIYESGEQVSVFGTCLDGDDEVVSAATAALSAWYPNGTLFINNSVMAEIQDGYFLYSAPMSAVQGTYLTEMRCTDATTNQTALAFGEWQNPFWVSRLASIQQDLNNLNISINASELNISVDLSQLLSAINNVSVQIGAQTAFINDSFNTTWNIINDNFLNITQQLVDLEVSLNDSMTIQTTTILNNLTTQLGDVVVNLTSLSTQIESNHQNITNQLNNISLDIASLQADLATLLSIANQTLIIVQGINQSVADLASNFTITIGSFRQNVTDSFQITWDKIDAIDNTLNTSFTNISEQIYWLSQVANNSVDRNDSYIVQLLLNITNTYLVPANLTGVPVGYTIRSVDSVIYWSDWDIKVDAYDLATGDDLMYPDVSCTISTTLSPTPQIMTPQGSYFKYSEFISALGDFSWTVVCFYN